MLFNIFTPRFFICVIHYLSILILNMHKITQAVWFILVPLVSINRAGEKLCVNDIQIVYVLVHVIAASHRLGNSFFSVQRVVSLLDTHERAETTSSTRGRFISARMTQLRSNSCYDQSCWRNEESICMSAIIWSDNLLHARTICKFSVSCLLFFACKRDKRHLFVIRAERWYKNRKIFKVIKRLIYLHWLGKQNISGKYY